MLRTRTCGELRIEHVGETVTICGWVQKSRDLGHFVFVDVRDRYGITQINVPATAQELYQKACSLGREFVVQVTGTVTERESKNKNIPTGEIEVVPTALEILNTAETPPFKIEDETDGLEDLRLQYRYLDIRRPSMAKALMLRHQMTKAVREYLDALNFVEVETPVLIKSTPEGARDFLVPSRLHEGNFYALPQSPQILKQLLMVAGMDRYYQIVKCYRDEDFRGDRQPEFTQIDCEMSFVTQDDVLTTFEGMVKHVFKSVAGVELPSFQRIGYVEALEKYGTDKPDLRFGSPIIGLNTQFANSGFRVFDGIIEGGGLIAGINLPGCAKYSNSEIKKVFEGFVTDKDRYKGKQAQGMSWIRYSEDGTVKSSLPAAVFTDEKLFSICVAMEANPGDLVLMMADKPSRTRKFLGDLRLLAADREGWRREGDWSVFWVVDFPLFERDEETNELTFAHHPFVMPNPEHLHYLDEGTPEKAYAWCYDLVMNGNELCSGSIRIHRADIQEKIFNILGLTPEEQQNKFGFLLNAFKYGAPPHGGLAFGLDRWAMLLAGGKTIRDVIAFPKNSSGRDMMMDAPSAVPDEALKDLHIKVR